MDILSSGASNVRQGDVADLDIMIVPLVEELDVADLLDNVLGEHLSEGRVLDLDIAAVRHVGYSSRAFRGIGGKDCGLVLREVVGMGIFREV